MRNDMFKVIVERPRSGVGYYRTLHNDYRAAKRFNLDEDYQVNDEFCGSKLPMRARRLGREGKTLNENLNPLRRFLMAQVGRPWNDVYSEICDGIDSKSTIKQHVRDHIGDFVTLKTCIDEDGDLVAITRYGHRHITYKELYVDSDGILRGHIVSRLRSHKAAQAAQAAKLAKTQRTINGVVYVLVNQTWFVVTTHAVSSYNSLTKKYEIYFEERKRTLSKKELKELRNLGLK